MANGFVTIPENSPGFINRVTPPTFASPSTGFNFPIPKYMNTNPNFSNVSGILSPLNPMSRTFSGGDVYNRAVNTLSPDTTLNAGGVSAGTQNILDLIAKAQAKSRAEGIAAARGLAAQRGQVGSSTEQFGVARAGAEADTAAINALQQTYAADLQRQQIARDLQAQILTRQAEGQQSMTMAEYDAELKRRLALAGYTSEEVASQRNAMYSQDYLEMQKILGEQGLAAAQANIDATKDIAKQQQKQQLLNTIIGGAVNLGGIALLRGGGGGGTGLFGGGGVNVLNAAGGGVGGVPYSGAGNPGSTLFPGGVTSPGQPVGTMATAAPKFGAGGTLLNTSGTSGFMGSAGGVGSVLGTTAAGIGGGYLGYQTFQGDKPTEGENYASATGAAMGAGAGSFFGPLGAAAGGFVGAGYGKASERLAVGTSKSLGNTAGSIVRYANPVTAISSTVQKVFGSKGSSPKNTTGGAGSWGEGSLVDAKKNFDNLALAYQSGQIDKNTYNTEAKKLGDQTWNQFWSIANAGSGGASQANPLMKQIADAGYMKQNTKKGTWEAVLA